MIINCLLALFAYKTGALNKKAIVLAYIVGVIVFFFNLSAYIILLMYFVGTTIVEKITEKNKNEKRSGRQVFVNFIFAFVSLILFIIVKKKEFFVLYCAMLAESMSDTLASTVGSKYAKKVYSIIKFRSTERGISGGVSLIGTAAGFFASIYIALAFFITNVLINNEYSINDICLIIFLGFFGMLIDSILGDTLQKKYRCKKCGKIGDKPVCCNEQSERIENKFLSNSQVNFFSELIIFILGFFILVIM